MIPSELLTTSLNRSGTMTGPWFHVPSMCLILFFCWIPAVDLNGHWSCNQSNWRLCICCGTVKCTAHKHIDQLGLRHCESNLPTHVQPVESEPLVSGPVVSDVPQPNESQPDVSEPNHMEMEPVLSLSALPLNLLSVLYKNSQHICDAVLTLGRHLNGWTYNDCTLY